MRLLGTLCSGHGALIVSKAEAAQLHIRQRHMMKTVSLYLAGITVSWGQRGRVGPIVVQMAMVQTVSNRRLMQRLRDRALSSA